MKTLLIAVALCCAFFAGASLAHGELHGRKGADYAKGEQTAFGRIGDPGKVSRTIEVDMSDQMRFTPESLSVKRGETVRFVVKNTGKQMHEMVLGTERELRAHADMMKKHPGMEHDEPYMAHVASGKSAEIVWLFNRAGEFHYGCLVPGHFDAGMKGAISVKP